MSGPWPVDAIIAGQGVRAEGVAVPFQPLYGRDGEHHGQRQQPLDDEHPR